MDPLKYALPGNRLKLLLRNFLGFLRSFSEESSTKSLLKITLLFATTSLHLSGCNSRHSEANSREDEIYHGNQLVQSGQYEEAIRYFQNINAEHPSLKARMGLASAYAARAGIMVNNYWGFAIGFKKKSNLETSNLDHTLTSLLKIDELQFLGDEERLKLQSIVSSLSQLKYLVERFDNLPLINALGKKDIELAIDVLEDLPSKGARVYRAILGAVLVKYTVLTETESWKIELNLNETSLNQSPKVFAGNNARRCFPSFSRLINSIESIFQVLIPLRSDLSYAFPSDGNKISNSFEEIEKAQIWLKENASQFSTLESFNICQ